MTDYDDTSTPCAASGCTRPADPVLCQPHERRLGDALAELGTLYGRLDAVPSMQGREPGSGGAGGLKSQRTPANLDVITLRHAGTTADPDDRLRSVLATLAGWAEMVRAPADEGGRGLTPGSAEFRVRRDDRHIGPYCDTCDHSSCRALTFAAAYWTAPTVTSERKLLADHLPWIVQQSWAGDFHDEITAVWGALKTATEGPRPRRTAACSCGGRITVTAMVATCDSCGTSWQGLDMAKLGAAA